MSGSAVGKNIRYIMLKLRERGAVWDGDCQSTSCTLPIRDVASHTPCGWGRWS